MPLLVLLIGACAPARGDAERVIPERFRGRWAASAAVCGVPGESVLEIHETRVDFYESRGRVLAAATRDSSELALLLEATGEGQAWIMTWQVALTPDGDTLVDRTGGPVRTRRIRCE